MNNHYHSQVLVRRHPASSTKKIGQVFAHSEGRKFKPNNLWYGTFLDPPRECACSHFSFEAFMLID
jgi:hypothetical protein